jgi:hypothetical protein
MSALPWVPPVEHITLHPGYRERTLKTLVSFFIPRATKSKDLRIARIALESSQLRSRSPAAQLSTGRTHDAKDAGGEKHKRGRFGDDRRTLGDREGNAVRARRAVGSKGKEFLA